MPKFLEKKLKKQYGADSSIPYKIMNARGYMHGNKETELGERIEAKHEAHQVSPEKKQGSRLRKALRGK